MSVSWREHTELTRCGGGSGHGRVAGRGISVPASDTFSSTYGWFERLPSPEDAMISSLPSITSLAISNSGFEFRRKIGDSHSPPLHPPQAYVTFEGDYLKSSRIASQCLYAVNPRATLWIQCGGGQDSQPTKP
jgi:hypothetical protein